MKKIATLLFAALMIFLFIGCPKDNDVEPDPGTIEMGIFTNPTDGTLFVVTMEDGREIVYYGDKDANGMPTALTTASVSYPDIPGEFLINLNDSAQPTRILAPNGTVFEFEWLSETTMRLIAISPTGEVQVSMPVDFNDLGGGKSIADLPANPPNIRDGMETVFTVKDKDQFQATSLKSGNGNLSFNIIQCGEPVNNAYVIVTTDPPIGQLPPANFDGDGNYSSNIPQSGADPADHEEECNKIGDIVDKVCDKFTYIEMFGLQNNSSQICFLLSGWIQDAFPNAGDAQSITNMCSNAFDAIPAICEFHNKTNIGDLCNLAHLLYEEPEQTNYTFSLSVTIPGQGTFETEDAAFDPTQPSSWNIDLGGEFAVQNLHTVPSDPGPTQGYVAYADVICPSSDGTMVTISVVGTDGYTDSKTYDLTANAEISLSVPGAAEGVMDVITVEAKGQQWQISIVF